VCKDEVRDLKVEVADVSGEVSTLTGALDSRVGALEDQASKTITTIGQNYDSLTAEIEALETNKVDTGSPGADGKSGVHTDSPPLSSQADRAELASKADSSDITAVTNLLDRLNDDLRGSFDAQHDIHNTSLELLFDGAVRPSRLIRHCDAVPTPLGFSRLNSLSCRDPDTQNSTA
jgi:hypothetical protein